MKKIVFAILAAFSLQVATAQDRKVDFNELPADAINFVRQHFLVADINSVWKDASFMNCAPPPVHHPSFLTGASASPEYLKYFRSTPSIVEMYSTNSVVLMISFKKPLLQNRFPFPKSPISSSFSNLPR